MRAIKDITKREFLEAFNKLRLFRGYSVNLKDIANLLDIIPKDLKRHFKDKIFIYIDQYHYYEHKNRILRGKNK